MVSFTQGELGGGLGEESLCPFLGSDPFILSFFIAHVSKNKKGISERTFCLKIKNSEETTRKQKHKNAKGFPICLTNTR